ncbi:MAG: protein kinase [Anaerolineales bacterium]|nr:protein kinase [Anaerolineales bacterium]
MNIDRYEIISEIGQGGMATVYLARDPRTDRQIAIKVLPEKFTNDPTFRTRFDREALTVAKLEHPDIVPVYDFGEENGLPYIVMRYMPGGTLAERMGNGKQFLLEEVIKILSTIAEALDAAHTQGVIHRDLKPANILFGKSGNAALGDFGIAKVVTGATNITGEMTVGTPSYMSPEQVSGKPLTPASDIYSLGVILYEMVMGTKPFTADTPMAVALKHITDPLPSLENLPDRFPEGIKGILNKVLAKEPDDRYGSAVEMVQALKSIEKTAQNIHPQTLNFDPAPAISHKLEFSAKPVAFAKTKAPVKKNNTGIWLTCGVIALLGLCITGGLLLWGSQLFNAEPEEIAYSVPLISDQVGLPTPDGQINKTPFEAVVQIWAMYMGESGTLEVGWWGSGTVISPDGYILTNAHVVMPDEYFPVDALAVALTDNPDHPAEPKYYAKVMAVDEDLDIAVLRIYKNWDGTPVDYTLTNLSFVPLGDSDMLTLGDTITIIGYPGIGGETITLTRGEVSGFTSQEPYGDRAFVKTSATITGGNSGGLAATQDGIIIGIPTQLGYGGDDQFVDCRVLADTNYDGVVDDNDNCVPTGGFINALRPIRLALPLINEARATALWVGDYPFPNAPIIQENPEFIEGDGKLLIEDDFSNSNSGWDTGTVDGGEADYKNGKYELLVNKPEWVVWTNLDRTFTDTVVSVTMDLTDLKGEGEYGVMCRYENENNYYDFGISDDGYFIIGSWVGAEYNTLVDWTYSSEIPIGGGEVRVTVGCVEDTLSLVINGVPQASVQDETHTNGELGLYGITYENSSILVQFDDFVVEQP